MRYPTPLLLMLLLAVAACDASGPEDSAEEGEYVVESYQIAGEALGAIRLSRTAPLEGTYDFSALAVQDADVVVELLEREGEGVEAAYAYREVPDSVGVYEAEAPEARVRPLRRYRLRVGVPEAAGGPATVTATTTVPDTFSVIGISDGDVTYQQDEQVALTVTRSRYPGRDQAYYVLSVESLLDPLLEEALTPFVARFFEEDRDGDLDLNDLRVSSSPVLNEANYVRNAEGTLTVELPWLAVAFYGPNRLRANAIDDNLYDFVRTLQVQQGGSTLSPGEIPNIIEHVEGGAGVFGSLARQSFDIIVRRPEEDEPR